MTAPHASGRPLDSSSPEPRRSIGALLTRIRAEQAQALDRELASDPVLAPFEVTAAQYSVLNALVERDVDCISRLCKDVSYDPGAMTRMIDRLEAKGLIRRGRSTSDRRRVGIELTEAGEDVVPRMRALSAAVLDRLLAGFSGPEVAQLRAFLDRMAANL